MRKHHMNLDFSAPLAEWKYKKILKEIKDFQAGLDNDHEIAACFVCLGANIKMTVYKIGYQNPDILCFYGLVDGKEAQLIQHMNQLNFLLMAVDKSDPDAPPRRISLSDSK